MKMLHTLLLAGLLTGAAAAPAQSTVDWQTSPPEEATSYAQNGLVAELREDLRGEATEYGLEAPLRKIRVGPLHQVFSEDFQLRSGPLETRPPWVEATSEWVAVVYQRGEPRNVVGIEDTGPRFEMTVFGYGTEVAEAIDKLPPGAPLLYQPTAGLEWWHTFDDRTVTLISGGREIPRGRIMSWQEYQHDYARRLNEDVAAARAAGQQWRTLLPTTSAGGPRLRIAVVVAVAALAAMLLGIGLRRRRP